MTFASDQQRKWYFATKSGGGGSLVSVTQLSASRVDGLRNEWEAAAARIRSESDPNDKGTWDAARWAVHDDVERLRDANERREAVSFSMPSESDLDDLRHSWTEGQAAFAQRTPMPVMTSEESSAWRTGGWGK